MQENVKTFDVGNILQCGEQMKKEPLRVVCSACRVTIAESEYNYEKQQYNFVIKEECCDDSLSMLSRSVMNDVQESEKPSLKKEGNKGEIEPSFYSWEINR